MSRAKRVSSYIAVLVLVISSLPLGLTSAVHALGTTLYWCDVAGTGTVDFNTAGNWNTNSSCSGGTAEVPAAGFNLVFDNTNLTASETINDDISGLSLGSITFQGTSASFYGYTLASTNSYTLTTTTGITQNANSTATLKLNLTLSGSQAITNTSTSQLNIGDSTGATATTLTIGSNTLTLTGNATCAAMNVYSALSGGGALTDNYTSGGVSLDTNSPNFTGTINVNGAFLNANSAQALGSSTATTVVASGASLGLGYAANTTYPENITLSGAGSGGAGTIVTGTISPVLCGAGGGSGNNSTTYTATLSGTVTLQSNATVLTSQGYNLTVAGPLAGAFTLTAASGSTGTLTIASSNNTSNTPNTPSASSTPTTPTTPGTPDTGFALAAAHPAATFAVSAIAAGLIAGLAFRANRKLAPVRAKTGRK
ncbi:MAG TPA: hypothetical protein VMB52_00625 [Verrucomicrobiae bacterium]|nr:hypothetical protein [Verrucomicrobiae bacterium]